MTRTVRLPEINQFDYTKVVVNKPWGYEYLMYENANVAIWILHLVCGHATSIHCHLRKQTALIVIAGNVTVSTLNSRYDCGPLGGVILEAGVFHTTRATSPEGAFVMEIESPPDKQDLLRLRDEYGRGSQGYENISQYSDDFSRYEYIAFHDRTRANTAKTMRGIGFRFHRSFHTPAELEYLYSADIVALCAGNAIAGDGKRILASGDACRGGELQSRGYDLSADGLEILTLRRERGQS
jgi:mannose-6-phosphate isomerase-like protein (cupin superfamily)